MITARSRNTGCWLLWLRADLDRDEARAYWRGPHAELVGGVGGIEEYRQLHFSARDHGFWPGGAGVGTRVPADWRVDGMPEVTFSRSVPSPGAAFNAVRHVFPDEANAFDRVLGLMAGPGGGRWFGVGSGGPADGGGVAPPGHGVTPPELTRAVVLIRRRPGIRLGTFRAFVHGTLGPALAQADGAAEVRTHAFLPYSWLLWRTPSVAHDNPVHRRYNAAVVVGAADRAALDAVLGSPEVSATGAAQAAHCVALHAYAVEETVVVVRDAQPQMRA